MTSDYTLYSKSPGVISLMFSTTTFVTHFRGKDNSNSEPLIC